MLWTWFDLFHAAKCVDKYTEYQSTPTEKPKMASSTAPDDAFERLAGVINRLFELCIASKKYHEAIGIALETRRLDVVRRCITLAVCTTVISFVLLFPISLAVPAVHYLSSRSLSHPLQISRKYWVTIACVLHMFQAGYCSSAAFGCS